MLRPPSVKIFFNQFCDKLLTKMKNLYFLLLVFILIPILSFSQSKKYNIGVVDFRMPSYYKWKAKKKEQSSKLFTWSDADNERKQIQQLRDFAIEAILTDKRFVLIDRNQLRLVEREQDLQKSEDFIDGYIVEQGKQIGADYILSGNFNLETFYLDLSLSDVAEKTTVSKKSVPMKKSIRWGLKGTKKVVKEAVLSMMYDVAPPSMRIVRETKGSGSKVKEVLISGGDKIGLAKGKKLQAFVVVEEEIDGEVLTRFQDVGVLTVVKTEGPNFSNCKVKDGGEEIKSIISSGKKVYCKMQL